MRKLTLLWLAVSGGAWAQDAEKTEVDAPVAAEAPAPAAAVTQQPCAESATVLPQPQTGCPPSKLLRGARIAVELVLGGALGSLGELAGAYIGLNLDILGGREGSAGLSIGAGLGAALSVGPAVWLAGSAMGGDGSFGWTFLGGAAGTVVSAIAIGIKNTTATWVVGAITPVLGAVLGYELSSNAKRPAAASTGVSIVPTISTNGVGVAGRF